MKYNTQTTSILDAYGINWHLDLEREDVIVFESEQIEREANKILANYLNTDDYEGD